MSNDYSVGRYRQVPQGQELFSLERQGGGVTREEVSDGAYQQVITQAHQKWFHRIGRLVG